MNKKKQGKKAPSENPPPGQKGKNDIKAHTPLLTNLKASKKASFAPPSAPDQHQSFRLENANYLAILTLIEVAHLIKVKDIDTVKNWLFCKRIQVHKIGKKLAIYEIDFKCAMALEFVHNLRCKYPKDWQSIYQTIEKDEIVYQLVVRQVLGSSIPEPATVVQPRNAEDRKLLKELTSEKNSSKE